MSFNNVGSITISGNLVTGNTSTIYNIYGPDEEIIRSVLPIPLDDQQMASTRETHYSLRSHSNSPLAANPVPVTPPPSTAFPECSLPTSPARWERPVTPLGLYRRSLSPTPSLSSLGSLFELQSFQPRHCTMDGINPHGTTLRSELVGASIAGPTYQADYAFPHFEEIERGDRQRRQSAYYSPTETQIRLHQPPFQHHVSSYHKDSPRVHMPEPQPIPPLWTRDHPKVPPWHPNCMPHPQVVMPPGMASPHHDRDLGSNDGVCSIPLPYLEIPHGRIRFGVPIDEISGEAAARGSGSSMYPDVPYDPTNRD